MSGTRLALTVDLPVLDRKVSWAQLESLMVELGHRAPAEVLALVLDEAQELLVEQVCGPGSGCETVARSPYSRLGGLPLAAWGLAFSARSLAVMTPVESRTHLISMSGLTFVKPDS